MIAFKPMGGLGNQMFQYAISYAQGQDVYIDFTFLKRNKKSNENFTARQFELNIFPNVKWNLFSEWHRFLFLSNSENRWLRRVRKVCGFYCSNVVQHENEYVRFQVNPHMYFVGYFQSEKYFKHKRKELLEVFSFPELDSRNLTYLQKILESKNAVSIHIRQGDYLKPSVLEYHGVLPKEYYTRALDFILAKYPEVDLFVFSDNLSAAKSILGGNQNVTFISGNESSAWQDMALMSRCKHHIIANSSFSWWGAWLSQETGITVAPENWFNKSRVKFNIHDFIPDSWEVLQ